MKFQQQEGQIVATHPDVNLPTFYGQNLHYEKEFN